MTAQHSWRKRDSMFGGTRVDDWAHAFDERLTRYTRKNFAVSVTGERHASQSVAILNVDSNNATVCRRIGVGKTDLQALEQAELTLMGMCDAIEILEAMHPEGFGRR